MKYKTGDIVELKSKEELIKSGTWYKECAEACGGKSYKITAIDGYSIIGNEIGGECRTNVIFSKDSIDHLVSECSLQNQEDTYTFDELKKRVDELKGYLLDYTTNTKQIVEIHLQTSRYYMGYDVTSKIEITD